MTASINEIVGFLNRENPKILDGLRKRFPGSKQLLTPGKTLGDVTQKGLLIKGEVAVAGLIVVLNICDKRLPPLKRQLKLLGNLQMFAQAIIALSGATLLIQNQNTYPQIKLFIGVLALTGSLFTIYIQNKSGTISNNSQSIISLYDQLIDLRFEAEALKQELTIELQLFHDNYSSQPFIVLIDKANNVCLQIRKILDKM